MPHNPIYVTQPFIPPLGEFEPYLKEIWQNKWLTNQGPFHDKLEKALCEYLGVKYISLFANGTLALITALQALDIKGEVITTPFSFVATTHALWWNGITPVFVDIEENSCNLDPLKIEAAITSKTSAILPVHVYGNPCNIDGIQSIANKHHIKVVYDAAHAFGVKQKNVSVCNFGDLSILSFHATKIFNTFEGGAIVSHTPEMKEHIDFLKNFGYNGELTVVGPGINAKMNEIQAAFGLLHLKYMEEIIEKRKTISNRYRSSLTEVDGISFIDTEEFTRNNYAYFPIFIKESNFGMARDEVNEIFKQNQVFGRRYFYPLISQFPVYKDLPSANPMNLQVAEKKAGQVYCLPIYPDLSLTEVDRICEIIIKAKKGQ
jgi:dTDP-4-amino-4,6-dideoxygalactose transaminase